MTCIWSAINQLETYVSPTTICCCLQTCTVVTSEEMVADTCVPSVTVIDTVHPHSSDPLWEEGCSDR